MEGDEWAFTSHLFSRPYHTLTQGNWSRMVTGEADRVGEPSRDIDLPAVLHPCPALGARSDGDGKTVKESKHTDLQKTWGQVRCAL